jgi:formate dehydrogenase beta subunit
MLVRRLMEIQRTFGYLPKHNLGLLSEELGIPKSQVWDVAAYFPSFLHEPGPELTIGVCRDMTCHLRGAVGLLRDVRRIARAESAKSVSVETVSCLGRCDRAPVVQVRRNSPGAGHPEYLDCRSWAHCEGGAKARIAAQIRDGGAADAHAGPHSNGSAGAGEAWTIDVYDQRNLPSGEPPPAPFSALKAFVSRRESGELIQILSDATLVGLGGALARTGKKWSDVARERKRPKYVVANGDESEPGTFKDRELLLHKAHLVVEGVALAGVTLGAANGYIYIRHEYEEQIAAVDRAIAQARREVPEAFTSFTLETFESPGGYICGEQSALVEAIEGHRAQPREAFPGLQTNGIDGCPTLVNNVETFAWVPGIALRGASWYANARRRLFSISGDLERPGVYEVPFEATLGSLIEMAGGMRGGLPLKAVAPSGPSGGFVPRSLPATDIKESIEASLPGAIKRSPADGERLQHFLKTALAGESLDILDMPLDGGIWRATRLMLGAGIVVYAEGTWMMDQAINCLNFFHKESCGKCTPCRIGCQKLVRIAGILRETAAHPIDCELIDAGVSAEEAHHAVLDLARAMDATSICSLGRGAANPLVKVLEYFPEECVGLQPASKTVVPDGKGQPTGAAGDPH